MIAARTIRAGSTMLEIDAFQDVGDVLGAIRRVFEQPVELSPAHAVDQCWDVGRVVVENGQRLIEDIIGLVLEAMDLDDVAADLIAVLANVAEQRTALGKPPRLFVQEAREEPRRLGRLRKPVQPEALSGFLGGVDQVVELDGKLADVLAVEGCDERAVERAEDAVGDLVATMLQIAPPTDVPLTS